ncbi:RNA polymerase sigma factor [Mucilaginibacter pallidiroseus]|uniref:RNA polymerase sigma factor n=1 Tax=Mucilaginibacter pallidiroseus TaxID=2599295 RepID=A0A563UEE2_9SPHI|nr:RNA polymerase sigma factor [Mucilaginibacter pallidiroseus]TWR29724.1 RNA polymerase sigma factor [Mucilaginibacter pallidiroseus]
MTPNTDNRLNQLWAGCLKNDRKQQEMLYKILAPKMLAVCMRYAKDKDEAQDILQEGFIKMFKNMNNYRGEGSLEGWIRRIMVHSAISRYRKAKTTVLVEDFAEQNIPMGASSNGNNLEAREIMQMVDELPTTYRSVFSMYAIQGYSHQEIGNSLGISELLSRTTLHRARTMLKNKLMQLTAVESHCFA